MNISEEYFKNCLNSEVIDPDYLDTLWDKLVASLGNIENAATGGTDKVDTLTSDDVTNFLLMETDSSAVEISKAYSSDEGGSDLANPVFIKAQIIEFMKYRAPIGLAESILSEIQNMDAELQQTKKDNELQKKEEKTYRAESEFMQKMQEAYLAMKAYEELSISESMLNNLIGANSGYQASYQQIHERMIKNYAGIDPSASKYPQTSFKYQYSLEYFMEPLYYGNQKYGNTAGKSSASASNSSDIAYIKDTIKAAVKQITVFENKKSDLETKVSNALSNAGISGSDLNNSVYAVRVVSQIYSTTLANAITEYNQAADALMDYYVKLENIRTYGADALNSIEDTLTIKNTWSDDNSAYASDYLNVEKTYQDHLEKAAYMIYDDTSGNNIFDKYMSASAWNTPTTAMKVMKLISDYSLENTDVKEKLVNQRDTDSTELKNIADEIQGRIDVLDTAIDKLQTVESCLTSMEGFYNKYSNYYSSWSSYSTTYSSDYCDVSRKSLDEDELKNSGITSQGLVNFKARITNTKNLLKEVQEKLENIKYGNKNSGKELSKIKSIDNMISATTVEDNVKGKITEADLKNFSDSLWSAGIFSADLGSISVTDDNNPQYSMDNHSAKENPVYEFMMNRFKDKEGNASTEEFDKKDRKKDDAKNEVQEIEDDTSLRDIKTGLEEFKNSYPSKLAATENGVDLLSGTISLVGDFARDGFDETIERYRDALYVADYCIKMFSYVTYEEETKYDYMTQANKANSSKFSGIQDMSCRIAFDDMLDITYSSYKTELSNLLANTDPQVSSNKSLTNKMISSSNNYAYTRELEYILFGKENKENVKEMATELFELRYALNLGPGIARFWSDSLLKEISAGISVATGGIVPEPLIRMVLILLLIGMESLNDVNLLMEGIPVQFLKAGENSEWVYDINGGIDFENLSSYSSSGSHKDNVLRFSYSDYMMLLLFFQLKDTAKANNTYKRIGDVIQANMSQQITKKQDYNLSNAITQYKISYTLTVHPLILDLGIYNGYGNNPSSLTEWRTFTGTMARGY